MKKASFILTTIFIINLLLALLPATAQQTPDDDIQAIRELSETIKASEDLLQKYPEKDFTPTLMFQLSELYIKRSTLKFQREMMIYEEEERKVNSGVLKKKLALPKINFDEAINISFKL